MAVVLLDASSLLSNGFAAVTHKAARIYFVLFHITVVIIIIK